MKIIAYPDIREWGNSACSTGSKMSDVLLGIGGKGIVDCGMVEKGWEINREDKSAAARRDRVRRVLEDVWSLGQESLKVGGMWRGREVGRADCTRVDVEIVLVSHAAFLGTLEGTDSKYSHISRVIY